MKTRRRNIKLHCAVLIACLNVFMEEITLASETSSFSLQNETYSLQLLSQQMSSLEVPLLSSMRASDRDLNPTKISLGDDNFVFGKKIGLAKKHLLAGDSYRALEIVDPLLESTLLPKHSGYIDALKVQFEGNRLLKKTTAAVSTCLKVAGLNTQNADFRITLSSAEQKNWLESCSAFFAISAKNVKTPFFKNSVHGFVNSEFVGTNLKNSLFASISLSLTLAKTENFEAAIKLLEEQILKSKVNDPLLIKAKFTLYLLRSKKEGLHTQLSDLLDLARNGFYPLKKTWYDGTSGDQSNLKYFLASYFSVIENWNEASEWLTLLETENPKFLESNDAAKALFAMIMYERKNYSEGARVFGDLLSLDATHSAGAVRYLDSQRRLSRILTLNPKTKQIGIKKFIEKLGAASADLKFVNSLGLNKNKASLEDMFWKSEVLTKIAQTSAAKSPSLTKLNGYLDVLARDASARVKRERELSDLLSVILKRSEERNASAFVLTQKAVNEFQVKLVESVVSLDSVSKEIWTREPAGAEFNQQMRSELLRRFEVFNDGVSLWSKKRVDEKDLDHNQEALAKILDDNQKHQVMTGSILVTAEILKRKQLQGTVEDLGPYVRVSKYASRLDQIHVDIQNSALNLSATTQMWNLRREPTARLLDTDLDLTKKRLKTLESLWSIHKKFIDPEHERFQQAEQLWELAISLQRRLSTYLEKNAEALSKSNLQLSKTTQDLSFTLATLAGASQVLKDGVLEKLPDLIVQTAKDIRPVVSEQVEVFQLELARVDIGQADAKIIEKNRLDEAIKEREKWHENLRQSLSWGLAR